MTPLLAREFVRLVARGDAGRRLVSILAIALGVALGYAVHLIHHLAVSELEQAARRLAGVADLAVVSHAGSLDESWFARLAKMDAVAHASPVVEVEARVPQRREPLRILGIDVLRAGAIQPALLPRNMEDRLDSLRSDRIFLNPAGAAWLGVERGDELVVQSGLEALRLRVAGSVEVGATPLAVMDIAAAQARLGTLGRITRVDLRLRPGTDRVTFARRLQAMLPPDATVATPESESAQAADFTRAYRVNLNVLSLVALFTGGLLVFSSQALSVIRRRTQIALLRALGMTRRQVLALLVTEGGLIGLIGGLVGLVLGALLARAVLSTVGAGLGAAYFRGVAPELALQPLAGAAFLGLGMLAAAAGSFVPARESARASPSRALHAGDDTEAFAHRGSVAVGLSLVFGGAALALLPPLAGLPLFGYVSIALLLLGCIALLPRFAAGVFALLPTPRSAVGALALAQLRGAPGQAAVSLAPLVASIAIGAAMAIMVGSFRHSLEAWLERMLPADLYVRAGFTGDSGFFSAQEQERIERLPGVRRADFVRTVKIAVAAGRPALVLIARPVDPARPQATLPVRGQPVRVPDGARPIWISEVAADLYGWRPGEQVQIATLPGSFLVAGVWRDYARTQGAIVMSRAQYQSLTGDGRANEAALWLASDASIGQVERALQEALPPGSVDIARPEQLRRVSLRIFDRTFAATYGLEASAIVVGLAGLSASFAALVMARRREFGVLRHLGMRRREIGRMLVVQGALLAAAAIAVGLALGAAISAILIFVVNRQSFHWSMDVAVPWGELLAFGLALLVLAALTTLASGRQAMRREAALSVKEDW